MTDRPAPRRPAVVLDCDPGIDDAFALFAAARFTELLGVTTVAGNAELGHVTSNALRLVELIGVDVAVHAGAAGPLVGGAVKPAAVHGDGGLAGLTLPPPVRATASADAAGFLVETCRRPGVTIVATGPLTNVALALRGDPGLAARVASITLMGGAVRGGNVTAAAEFNVWTDPEAAAEVFASGAPLTMVGLDLTHQVVLGRDHTAQLRRAATPTSLVAADLLDAYGRAHEHHEGRAEGAMHDPCAVLAVTHPHLFVTRRRHVDVECAGTLTRGMTVVDERLVRGRPPNAAVATGVDAGAVIELILAAAIDPLP